MKKYNKQDQRSLANCAADCAGRVLPFFEKAYPKDGRPRKAIEECRMWVRTGMFKMNDIRGTSLAAHAAAREAKENNAACFAAHAAGQAVATVHVSHNMPLVPLTMLLKPLQQLILKVTGLELSENTIGNHGVFPSI